MILPSQRLLRRLSLRRYRRPILALLLFLFLIDALVLLNHRPRTTRVSIPHDQKEKEEATERGGRVFIVSVHRNTDKILPAWAPAVLALIDHLGADNVYFSALESGSQDDTKNKLIELQWQLAARGVRNTVNLGMTVWEQLDEMWARPAPDGPRQPGWIWNPEDKVYDLRRITYLARERNRAMEPMWELERTQGIKFDKVLWLNDVIFNVSILPFPHPLPNAEGELVS